MHVGEEVTFTNPSEIWTNDPNSVASMHAGSTFNFNEYRPAVSYDNERSPISASTCNVTFCRTTNFHRYFISCCFTETTYERQSDPLRAFFYLFASPQRRLCEGN